MENKKVNSLVEKFKTKTENLSNQIEGIKNYYINEYYKKNNPEKGYHSLDAVFSFGTYELKLEYKINISMLIPKSTLEMRFMFEDSKLPVEYSIYDILDVIDDTNFNCYTFGYVTTDAQIEEILKYLWDTFIKYKEKIDELAINEEILKKLETNIQEKVELLLNEKIFETRNAMYLMHMLELYYAVDVSRVTSDAYIHYTEGNYKKSIKEYSKAKLTAYEKRLVDFMKQNKNKTINYEVMPKNLNTTCEARKLKKPKKELVSMYLSWILLTPIWSIIYGIIFYLTMYFTTKNAIYTSFSNIFYVITLGFITSVSTSYFVRKIMYKLLYRKQYSKMIALDEIENTSFINNIMSKVLQFVIALGIVFTILLGNTNISFYNNYFIDKLNLFNLKGTVYTYEDVLCVYEAEGIKTSFGGIIDEKCYVFVLKDGSKIDLYYDIDYSDVKENIIPICNKYNIDIRQIDLVNNIDKDLNKNNKNN